MRICLTVAFVAASLFCCAQNWQGQHDSAFYYLEIGYITKAWAVANRLPDTKDLKQQYQKQLLLSQIQMAQANLQSSIHHLHQARVLAGGKGFKLSSNDLIDLQFEFCDRYYQMNELEKADSVLEAIRARSGKTISERYYTFKYDLLKKIGKSDEAFELLENEIQPNVYLYRIIQLEDYISAGEYEAAASEIETSLEELKKIYPKESAALEEQFYVYRIQSAPSIAELKSIIRNGTWRGRYTTQLDWLEAIAVRAQELHDRSFADSISNRIMEISIEQFGERNAYHTNALLMMLNAAMLNDDLIQARRYAEQAKALLKIVLGETSVTYCGTMYGVLRYRKALGYDDEVNDFITKSLGIIEKEAGKKHSYYSTYASYYFKCNPKDAEAGKFLQEAVKQYNLDDSNCNGCYALVLSNLASYYERTGDVKQAEYYFRRAWEKSKATSDGEVFYRSLLTDFYRRCHALKVRSKLEFFPEEVRTMRNDTIISTYKNLNSDMIYISQLYQNYDDALKDASMTHRNELNYAKAKLAWSEQKESEATVAFETTMAEVVKGLDVLEYLDEAEKATYFKSVSEPVNAFYSFSISLNMLSTGFLMEEKYLGYIKEKLKTDSSSYRLEKVTLDKKNYYRFTLLHAKKALNMRLATKGMVFASTRKVQNRILNSGDSSLIRQFRELERLKKELASIYIADAHQVKEKEKTIQELTQQISTREIQLAEKSAAFRNAAQSKKITFETIQSRLKPGEAAVEVIRINHPLYYLSDRLQYEDSVWYAFIIIKPEDKIKPEVVVVKNGYDLENRFYKVYKNSIRFKLSDSLSYNNYWKAVGNKLYGRKKVYFSPDGIYNLISLNTLRDPYYKNYLLDQFDITLLPDLKSLAEGVESYGMNKSSVILGDPAFSESKVNSVSKQKDNDRSFQIADLFGNEIPRLEGTLTEVETIRQLLQAIQWKTQLFTGSAATETNLKKIAAPSLLHIATHGFFVHGDNVSSNPLLRSGLILAGVINNSGKNSEDGVLTAYEAQSLDLSATELVVLSACETGSGVITSGDGVYGLQRAFMTAGSKNVIMSLWSVDDAATSLLMRVFYREWTNGTSKAAALKKAELEVKQQYPSPYYWGAFVMLGN